MKIAYHARRVLHHANVPRIVCSHMLGDTHSHAHRMSVGAVVMIAGVGIAKSVGHSHYELIAASGDLLGYLVHGAGAVPYVDWFMLMARPKDEHTS